MKTKGLLVSLFFLCCLSFCPEATNGATSGETNDNDAQAAMALGEQLLGQWTESSLRQAITQFERAARISTSFADHTTAARATTKAGDIHFLLSDYRKALSSYQSSLALARKYGDNLGEATALSQVALVQSYLVNGEVAQKSLAPALEFFQQNESSLGPEARQAYGEALCNLGEIVYGTGNYNRAAHWFAEAEKYSGGNRKLLARIHLFQGYLNGTIGIPEKAEKELSEAINLYQSINDKVGEARARATQGLFYVLNQRLNQAFELNRQAKDIFHTVGNRISEASTLNTIGQAYERMQNWDEAVRNYQDALRIFEEVGFANGAAGTTCAIGKIYQGKRDPGQALKYFERCVDLSRSAGNLRGEVNAFIEIAQLYASEQRYELASQRYKQAQQFYTRIGDHRGLAQTFNFHGDLLLRMGQKQQALEAYQRALPFSEKSQDQDIVLTTFYNLTVAHRELGSLEVALGFIQQSLKLIEKLRSNVESSDFRMSYFAGVQKHYELCLDILMQLHKLNPGKAYDAQALLVRENSQARLLLDLLREPNVDALQEPEKVLFEQKREVLARLRAQVRFKQSLVPENTDQGMLAEADHEVQKLKEELQAIEARLKQQHPRLATPADSPPLQLWDIQRELKDDQTVLLEYSLGEETSYLWLVTSNSIRSYELPGRKTLEDSVLALLPLLTARQKVEQQSEGEYQANVTAADEVLPERATSLGQMLLGQVTAQLGAKRLLIVPDGPLQYLPFDALLPNTNGLPLIETNQVVMLPSVSTLIAVRNSRRRAADTTKLVAVIADPVFDRGDDRVASHGRSAEVVAKNDSNTTRSTSRAGEFKRLIHASEEADAISAMAPRGTYMVAKGFDANRELATRADLGQYQVVHFATHGFLNNEHPEQSGIALTMVDRDGRDKDGLMLLNDISSLNLATELTVLSACQTALGKDIRGEGMIGLAHSFMSAGSKSVVASLWKVDDQATAVLMADFYEAMWRKGMSPSEALRSAKLKMRRDPRWQSPYYWAGFVLQGEYENHLVVNTNRWRSLTAVFILVGVLIVLGLVIFQVRRRYLASPLARAETDA